MRKRTNVLLVLICLLTLLILRYAAICLSALLPVSVVLIIREFLQ